VVGSAAVVLVVLALLTVLQVGLAMMGLKFLASGESLFRLPHPRHSLLLPLSPGPAPPCPPPRQQRRPPPVSLRPLLHLQQPQRQRQQHTWEAVAVGWLRAPMRCNNQTLVGSLARPAVAVVVAVEALAAAVSGVAAALGLV
jgi:hypothetical protein